MVNIKVAVRIRPLSQRELSQGDEIVVRKENKFVVVANSKQRVKDALIKNYSEILEKQDGDCRQRSRRFSVDFCYDPENPADCSQEAVFNDIGSEILDSMFEGFNACVLAYGHSASGKTYTIMGLQDDPGLTPRLCQGLFQRLSEKSCDERICVEVAASFLEIYNEKVKDLLGNEETGTTSSNSSLRVREHPKLGPYVQGLSEHLVTDRKSLLNLLTSGNKKRCTATTENNIYSSRSHAVFTIHFRQTDGEKCETEKWSKVHLVDLAGSLQEISPQETFPDERATSAQSKARLQEGANINKSLVTLGNVISALAESLEANTAQKEHLDKKSWQPFVPYRDSVLTWLLKDTLGGNSNTVMIATISPASSCLSETINTLRYAKRTKRIVNHAIVNEDPKVRTIRELKKEIARLKSLLVSVHSVAAEGYSSKESWQAWFAEGGMNMRQSSKGREEKKQGEIATTRGSGSGHTTASVNDEKKPVVNGSNIDIFSHDSQSFSDSLESLASVFIKSKTSYDGENEAQGGVVGTDFDSCDNLKKEFSGTLHRSRPDLIKGISARFKERLPSTSSQSCTDASNLSQSTSDNSLNSFGSVEVQSVESKWEAGEPRQEEISAPAKRRLKIVKAVTTRLNVARKKPDERSKMSPQKEEKGEAEGLQLCKRERMKLFDLNRKMALNKKTKKTVHSGTQTDSNAGTIRTKEESVETYSGETPKTWKYKLSNSLGESEKDFVKLDLEEAVRLETVWASRRRESASQTTPEEKSDKSANTTPMEFSSSEEDCFSDDSLDLECKRKNTNMQERTLAEGNTTFSQRIISEDNSPKNFDYFEEGKNRNPKISNMEEYSFEEVTLPNFRTSHFTCEQKAFVCAAAHLSNNNLSLGKEENLSSDCSFMPARGTEFVSSSEPSSEDFIFYENPQENLMIEKTAPKDRELYTITENSELSDPSDAFSPIRSRTCSRDVIKTNELEQKWSESSKHALKTKEFEITTKSHIRVKPAHNKNFKRKGPESDDARTVAEELLGMGYIPNEHNGSKSRNISMRTISAKCFPGKEGEGKSEVRPAEKIKGSQRLGTDYVENARAGDSCDVAENNKLETKKTNSAHWRSNSEKQYLNLNIFDRGRTPFSIDTHLFGKEWSTDGMLTSADSVTLVFMGPAKSKSSVLMEIIKRSLERNISPDETPFNQNRSKNTGVQCDANLVRSVSVDTAMIALSKIVRNQEQSPNIVRTTSLDAVNRNEICSISLQEKGSGDRKISCQCDIKSNDFKAKTKKDLLEYSIRNELAFPDCAGNADVHLKKHEEVERPNKSVSWSGETKYNVMLGSGLHGKTFICEPPDTVTSASTFPEHGRFRKVEPDDVTDDFAIFLKEAIHLLKKMNSASSKSKVLSQCEKEKLEEGSRNTAEGTEKEAMRRAKEVELQTRRQADNWEEENGGVRTYGNGKNEESWMNSTWPRRAAIGKPPTGIRGKIGRSTVGVRSESFYSGDFLYSKRNCRARSGRIFSTPPKLAVIISGTNPSIEEIQSRSHNCRFSHGDEFKWEKPIYAPRMMSLRQSVQKLSHNTGVLEAEMDLKNCCRHLKLAAEQDEMREKISERRQKSQDCNGCKARFRLKSWCSEDDYESDEDKAVVGMRVRRRKERQCAGDCTCRALTRDPCKHLLTKGCQSNFELDSFGPGSNHCHQFCIFCRRKDIEEYSSSLELNSECFSDFCRLNYYGYCPCSSIRLKHVAWSPRAYMQHLLTLRRQIVDKTAISQRNFRSPREIRPQAHALSYFFPSSQLQRKISFVNCLYGNQVVCKRKMAILHKFTQKKAPRRKNALANAFSEKLEEDSSFLGTVALHLGDLKTSFDNGQWTTQLTPSREAEKETVSLRIQLNQLAEQSNLLKLKYEILLDLLTQEFLRRRQDDLCATVEGSFFYCDLKNKTKV